MKFLNKFFDAEGELSHDVNNKEAQYFDELLQTKINVHIPDGKGRTPLHVAVWRGALDITQRLLEAGADPVSFFFLFLLFLLFFFAYRP